MSGNIHPKPGPIFPCSVCAGNVTWWSKSVQCCTCSKRVHLRCSLLSLSKFRTLGSFHSWSSPPPYCVPACNTVTFSTVTSTVTPQCNTVTSPRTPLVCIPPLFYFPPPPSTNTALLPHPRLQTSYPLTYPLLPPLLPFLAHGKCFRTWVQITYQFFYLSSLSLFFAPTSIPILQFSKSSLG